MRPLVQTVNLSALRHNFNTLCALAPNSKTVAVVKADAYGCGLTSLDVLSEADYFAVACIEEALAIRQAGHNKPIVLLEGWFAEAETSMIENVIPVVATDRQLEWLLASCNTFSEIWVKIDTGMTRLGFLPEQVDAVLTQLKSRDDISQFVLMTHLASADECAHFTQRQLSQFNTLAQRYPEMKQCVCNSAGTIKFPNAHHDIVRLGIAMYGASPVSGLSMKPVVSLRTEVISVKYCQAGTSIGYGHTVTLSEPNWIAVIAVGYADGYPREHQTPPSVCINDKLYSVIGRVSMDMMMVQVDDQVHVGDSVELWGEKLLIDTVASQIGTISYTLLTNMASRVYRKYV